MTEIVLGVCGGIAAYKACELLRLLTESGHRVRVVPTASALRFVGAPTWAALSGNPVNETVWQDAHEVPHVRIGRHADLVLVAPARSMPTTASWARACWSTWARWSRPRRRKSRCRSRCVRSTPAC